MVDGAWREVFCTGLFEEPDECVGVEFFGLPHGDEILVPEL